MLAAATLPPLHTNSTAGIVWRCSVQPLWCHCVPCDFVCCSCRYIGRLCTIPPPSTHTAFSTPVAFSSSAAEKQRHAPYIAYTFCCLYDATTGAKPPLSFDVPAALQAAGGVLLYVVLSMCALQHRVMQTFARMCVVTMMMRRRRARGRRRSFMTCSIK